MDGTAAAAPCSPYPPPPPASTRSTASTAVRPSRSLVCSLSRSAAALLDPPQVVTTRIPRTAGGERWTPTADGRPKRERRKSDRGPTKSGRSSARSFGGLTNNEGGDGAVDADPDDGARAVTTAMVTVWNAALLPPRSLSAPLSISPSMDNHPLCFCCHGE